MTSEATRAGLGTARLALPPARVHVLRNAVVHPGSRVVTTFDGRLVSECVTSSMVGSVPLDGTELRSPPLDVDGTVAVFRTPRRSTYHTLVDDLPRAGLLIHPALARLGPITLVHDGPLDALEVGLLAHLGSRRVRLREVHPGRPLGAERVVVPAFVTRSGAGAVPSWYRRWSDGVPLPAVDGGPRRIWLDDAASRRSIGNRLALLDLIGAHGVEQIDPSSVDAMELLAILRGAELVVGSSRDAMACCLFSRSAHVVEVMRGRQVDPAIYYLAASKGLPYDFVPALPGSLDGTGSTEVDLAWLDRLLTRIG